mgnify:CR=1 FL=1
MTLRGLGIFPIFFHHEIDKALTYSSVKSRWKTVDYKVGSDQNREELCFSGFSIFGRVELLITLLLKIEIENRKKPSTGLLKIVHFIDSRVV